jgi:hypothetical protein
VKRIWIKTYIEILDDPKMGRLPDWLWRRAIELFLLAGENGNDGLLQPVMDMAWRLRTSEEKLTESLQALSKVGVVHETPEGWLVTHFKERQSALSNTERVQEFRKRKRNENETERFKDDVTSSLSISQSDSGSSEERGGVGEKTTKPELDLFKGYFGKFLSKTEISRWLVLFEAVGKKQADELATWAFKKEIHVINRGGLMDSLETAAKNWKANSNGKKSTPAEALDAYGKSQGWN